MPEKCENKKINTTPPPESLKENNLEDMHDLFLQKLIIKDSKFYYKASHELYDIFFPITIGTVYKDFNFGILDKHPNIIKSGEIGQAFIEWKIPKPQITLVHMFLHHSAQIYKTYKSEIEAFLVYRKENQMFSLTYPRQEISACRTGNWNYSDIVQGTQIICDMHSHHTMSCDFSGTDDNSDINLALLLPHISLIVKKIDSFNYLCVDDNVVIRISYFDGSRFYSSKLKATDVFSFDHYQLPDTNFIIEKEQRPVSIHDRHKKSFWDYGSQDKQFDKFDTKDAYFYQGENFKKTQQKNNNYLPDSYKTSPEKDTRIKLSPENKEKIKFPNPDLFLKD